MKRSSDPDAAVSTQQILAAVQANTKLLNTLITKVTTLESKTTAIQTAVTTIAGGVSSLIAAVAELEAEVKAIGGGGGTEPAPGTVTLLAVSEDGTVPVAVSEATP